MCKEDVGAIGGPPASHEEAHSVHLVNNPNKPTGTLATPPSLAPGLDLPRAIKTTKHGNTPPTTSTATLGSGSPTAPVTPPLSRSSTFLGSNSPLDAASSAYGRAIPTSSQTADDTSDTRASTVQPTSATLSTASQEKLMLYVCKLKAFLQSFSQPAEESKQQQQVQDFCGWLELTVTDLTSLQQELAADQQIGQSPFLQLVQLGATESKLMLQILSGQHMPLIQGFLQRAMQEVSTALHDMINGHEYADPETKMPGAAKAADYELHAAKVTQLERRLEQDTAALRRKLQETEQLLQASNEKLQAAEQQQAAAVLREAQLSAEVQKWVACLAERTRENSMMEDKVDELELDFAQLRQCYDELEDKLADERWHLQYANVLADVGLEATMLRHRLLTGAKQPLDRADLLSLDAHGRIQNQRIGSGGLGTVFLSWDGEHALKMDTVDCPADLWRAMGQVLGGLVFDAHHFLPCYDCWLQQVEGKLRLFTAWPLGSRSAIEVIAYILRTPQSAADPLTPREAAVREAFRITDDMAAGQAQLEAAGIISTDLKDSNFLQLPDSLCGKPGQRRYVSIDHTFKVLAKPGAKARSFMTTWCMAAPEMKVQDGGAELASPVYMLAVSLVEMLAQGLPAQTANSATSADSVTGSSSSSSRTSGTSSSSGGGSSYVSMLLADRQGFCDRLGLAPGHAYRALLDWVAEHMLAQDPEDRVSMQQVADYLTSIRAQGLF